MAATPALYFDDLPVDPDSDSRGLGPINARMIELFAPAQVIVNAMRLRSGQQLYQAADAHTLLVLEGAGGTTVRAAGRFSRPLTTTFETAFLHARRWPAEQRANDLFAPVGSDLGSVHRALLVARRSGARLFLYLVDDPLAALRDCEGAERHWKWKWLSKMLRQCAGLFAITEPLCRLIERHHGVAVTPLALPYLYDPARRWHQTKNQIIYVGSVNEIYEQELEYWIALLDRAGFFETGQLVVTGKIAPRHGVVCTTFATRRALEQEIADSRAALLPISSRVSDLCYSSFPSKTLDYLAFSRLILASAPSGSVVSDFFTANHAPYCFPERKVPIKTVMALLASSEDHLAQYRALIAKHFSPEAFVATVMTRIAGEN